MRNWDPRDSADAAPLRLSPRDRQFLADALGETRPARRHGSPRAHGASIVGLVLSLTLLAGLLWALWPSSPVAPEVLR